MEDKDLSKKSLGEILEDFEKVVIDKNQELIQLYKEYIVRRFSTIQKDLLVVEKKST